MLSIRYSRLGSYIGAVHRRGVATISPLVSSSSSRWARLPLSVRAHSYPVQGRHTRISPRSLLYVCLPIAFVAFYRPPGNPVLVGSGSYSPTQQGIPTHRYAPAQVRTVKQVATGMAVKGTYFPGPSPAHLSPNLQVVCIPCSVSAKVQSYSPPVKSWFRIAISRRSRYVRGAYNMLGARGTDMLHSAPFFPAAWLSRGPSIGPVTYGKASK